MSIWTIICLILAVLLGIISIIFALLKEKGAMLVSGYNTLTEEEREKYDRLKLSIDVRNSFCIWSVELFIGAAFSYLFNKYFAIIAFIIWIILFINKVHLNPEKAFAKYKK